MTKKERRALRRRDFIVNSGLSAAALLIGCADPEDPKAQPDMPAGDDLGADLGADMAPDLEADEAPDQPAALVSPITKLPWVQLMDAGSARLRFESSALTVLPVTLTRESAQVVAPTLRIDEVAYTWPLTDGFKRRTKHPDESGTYSMQDVMITDLKPGELVRWSVGDDVTIPKVEGSFKAAPAPGSPVRIGWISDTMMPAVEQVSAMLAELKPELVLHGGDIQYMTNPFDTWSGAINTFAAFTQNAPIHFCIGNHEYEDQDEFEAQYIRLFGAHGEADRTVDYHVINYGSLRIFMLNSEIEMAEPESDQNKWLRAHLEALPAGIIPIVAFHRPYFSFGRSKPRLQTRDLMHPLLAQHRVPLVLTGHCHSYERFEADGVQYLVDGGGGAFLYDPDDTRAEVLAERPGDADLRRAGDKSHGALIIETDAAGNLKVTRHALDGSITEAITIAAR